MSKKYDYKDQELDLKMRIKFLEKKLREPDHGVEQYEEWQSNLEMVTDELTKLQVKKFKFFLGKWVHNFKEQNQLINVVDCMFVALEKTDQKDVAMKVLSKTILRLKSQIYEKQKIIDENVRMGGWNTEWRAKEFEELNSFYDAYFALIEANDFIDDLQKEK